MFTRGIEGKCHVRRDLIHPQKRSSSTCRMGRGTPGTTKVKLKKDNGDGSFDIMWLEDEAEDTANLEDLKRLAED